MVQSQLVNLEIGDSSNPQTTILHIDTCAMCLSLYCSPSTGLITNIVPFTLEQNNFILIHILQFPNFAHMKIEVMYLSIMVPFYRYTAILGYTTIVQVFCMEPYTIDHAD